MPEVKKTITYELKDPDTNEVYDTVEEEITINVDPEIAQEAAQRLYDVEKTRARAVLDAQNVLRLLEALPQFFCRHELAFHSCD